jgi:hypothetical protein
MTRIGLTRVLGGLGLPRQLRQLGDRFLAALAIWMLARLAGEPIDVLVAHADPSFPKRRDCRRS